MENQKMEIRKAEPWAAPWISKGIMTALGDGLCESFAAGDPKGLEKVERLFRICAESNDSQYSWRNSFVALSQEGEVMGIAVCYDGARLDELRRRFLDEFERMHGYRVDNHMTAETSAGEYYLDSLAVFPDYRGQGVARALIGAVAGRAAEARLPVGLLVDKTNHRARGLYDRLGFRQEGERSFAGERMDHLVLRPVGE